MMNVSMQEKDSKMMKGVIWKEAMEKLLDPTSEMSPEQKAEYEAKIRMKLKTGKRLTAKEMNYLRVNNPTLYRTARRVEIARQGFRERLKHCRSKEEVQMVITGQMQVVEAMPKEDPDREYMAAMVKHEMDSFRQSKAYAKLPEKVDHRVKKKQQDASDYQPDDEEDESAYSGLGALMQGQFQCGIIDGLAQSFS